MRAWLCTLMLLLAACGSSAEVDPDATPAIVAPEFSVASGTFTGTFELELSTPSEATIFFTQDGSLPGVDNGTVYTAPITVSSTGQVAAVAVSDSQVSALRSASYLQISMELAAYSSALPIVVVDNHGGGSIPNKGWSTDTQTGADLVQPERQAGLMQILNRDAASNTASLLGDSSSDTRIGIRVRGAFSSTWEPPPFSIENWQFASDSDRKVELLGMPSNSDWILYYLHPDYDRSLLYNTFIWELSRGTGRYGPAFRFVDVFANTEGGELLPSHRLGVYALVEKVKRGASRVDFDELSADGATGGWLLGINRMDPEPSTGYPAANGAASPQFFHTPGPDGVSQTAANQAGGGDDIPRQYNAYINFEDPNGYKINQQQRSAIEQWFVDFEAVLYDDAIWLDPVVGYRKYLNTRDFIDYFHLLNLAKQGDGLLISMYPWVSSGERKLHMGPMWDFNNGSYESNTDGPLLFRQDRLWYPRLFDDPQFRQEFFDRWHELRLGALSDQEMNSIVDRQAAEIGEALAQTQGLSPGEWNTRLGGMKAYLAARADWLDNNYAP